MAYKVLMIEDEQELALILGDYLKVEGYEVRLANDGEAGLLAVWEFMPDLVLLDIMLPKCDGVSVCKKIRETMDIPIIMLSAKSGEMDKVICLGIGADDYVTKPFSPLELVARVKAHLRRAEKILQSTEDFAKNAVTERKDLKAGRLKLNKDSYECYVDSVLMELTTREFEILYFFADHQNQVFSKEQIYENIWGMNEYGDISSVAVYINRLRDKLKQFQLDYIKTVWGVGYKFFV